MTRVVVLEDEPPARDRLVASLVAIDPGVEVVATLASVADAVAWFRSQPPPDLVFADIQLADGSSLDIFARVEPSAPVVFCTAYDEYVVEALAQNGIAYLLKPYSRDQLASALSKYRRLEAHFTTLRPGLGPTLASDRLSALAQALRRPQPARRLLARQRDAFVAVPISDIAYVGVRDGTTQIVCRDGRVLELDRSLADLDSELTEAGFFRVNRQYLVHADAVRSFRAYFKGRLLVELEPATDEDVLVSQPNAARFRGWLEGG